jgi:hypothetical protein
VLRGPGGGGSCSALVSTGLVELCGVVVLVAVVGPGAFVEGRTDRELSGACVGSGGEALSPPPDESTIVAIKPPAAAAATAAASAAFFTGSEATLAPPCLHASKSS